MYDMDRNSQDAFAVLYSGGILKAVVQALDIEDDTLQGRTARRFFAGKSVNEHNRGQIFDALGQALIDRGIIPESVDALPDEVSTKTAAGMAVALVCERWDHSMSIIQSRGSMQVDVRAVGEGFLRLVAIDLSLRIFALTRLSGLPLPDSEPPLWVKENGGGKILRNHLRQAELSRDQLAACLGASYTSVDNWLDGKNWPNRVNVAALSRELSPAKDKPAIEEFEQELNRQFTLARLADLLAVWIGRDAVVNITVSAGRFIRLLAESIDFPLSREEYANHVELRLLLYGRLEEAASVLSWWLAKLETDQEWKRDLLAASEPWEFNFEHIMARHSSSSAAGLSQDISEVAGDDASLLSASNIIRQELQAEANTWESALLGGGDLLMDGINRRRNLALRFPLSPDAYYQLGSFLGMAGKHLRSRKLVDEGIVECKIASGLLPEWDSPAVECGIMLVNIGEYDDALRELEQARSILPEETPHLRFITGYVLTMLERYADALEHLESVIKDRPNFALAHRYAAQCAFRLGNKVKGRRFAKEARRLGDFTEYIAWQDGKYTAQ